MRCGVWSRTYINSCWNGRSRLYSSECFCTINSVLENARLVTYRCPWVGHHYFASSATLACARESTSPSKFLALNLRTWMWTRAPRGGRVRHSRCVPLERVSGGRRYGENDYRKVVSTHVLSHCITPSPRCTSAHARTTAQGKLIK